MKNNDSVTVKLNEPVEHGSETITEMTVVKPRGKHLRKLPANPTTGDNLDLLARLTGHPPSVIDELGADDIEKLSMAVEGFLPPGRLGGGNK